MHDARSAVNGLGRREHLIGNGRGEDLAGTGGVEHSLAHESAVERLMARAAARDESHLARDRRVLAQDELVLEIGPDEIGMGSLEAGQRLLDHLLGDVDELLHAYFGGNAHFVVVSLLVGARVEVVAGERPVGLGDGLLDRPLDDPWGRDQVVDEGS